MDHMRCAEIIGELTGYQEGVKLSAIGSTVTVQECKMLAEQNGALIANANAVMEHNQTLRDMIERLQKENEEFREERDMAMSELEPLIEQASQLQAEVERLKEELLQARRDCMGDLEKRYQWGML